MGHDGFAKPVILLLTFRGDLYNLYPNRREPRAVLASALPGG